MKRKGRRTCPGSSAAKQQRRARLEALLIVGPRRRGRRRARARMAASRRRVRGWVGWCMVGWGEREGLCHMMRWRRGPMTDVIDAMAGRTGETRDCGVLYLVRWYTHIYNTVNI